MRQLKEEGFVTADGKIDREKLRALKGGLNGGE